MNKGGVTDEIFLPVRCSTGKRDRASHYPVTARNLTTVRTGAAGKNKKVDG